MKTKWIVLSLLAIFLLGACVKLEQICADSVETALSVNFKQKLTFKDRSNQDSVVVKDTFVHVKQIRAIENNTIVYDRETLSDSIQKIDLKYNPLKDSVSYIFSYNKGNVSKIDTVSFSYARKIALTSPECGVRTDYSNTQIKTSLAAASVKTTNQTTTADVYFK